MSNNYVKENILYCQYCNRECKNLNSLKQHECRCKLNPNRIDLSYYKTRDNSKCGWSRGLTKHTDPRVAKHGEQLKEYYLTHDGTFKGKRHSKATKQKLSEIALTNNYQDHFGSHKSYTYKGIKFISSYEVAVAESLDSHNIKWLKPKSGLFKYKDLNGKQHTYTPDFYLIDYDIYLDPKNDYLITHVNPTLGYSDQDKIHWVQEQNSVKIFILDKTQLDWPQIKEVIFGEMEELA